MEPRITVNGYGLTELEGRVVRMGLDCVLRVMLEIEGKHGNPLSDAYIHAIHEVQRYIQTGLSGVISP